ncbi:MAG: T9SS type A sorting domain-containing protein [Chitinophagales bacterium]|nr:T9SS type A sorting domain-containing protein [Chitinophagales bacterium]
MIRKKLLRQLLFSLPFIVFFISFFNSEKVTSNSFRPPTGRTQDPVNNSTCAASGCHDSWAPFNLERAIITIGPNISNQSPLNGFQYSPGTQYVMVVTVLGTANRYGFQMSALGTSNQNAGTFSNINSNTSVQSQNGISYIGHQSASGSVSSWSFNWTAPPQGFGNVTFYTAINKAYAPSGDANDSIFHRTYTVTPAPAIPPTVRTNNDTTICAGKSIQLSTAVSNAQGSVTYSWQPGSGLSCVNCPNPVATPSQTTTYIVTVNASNGTARDTVIINVTSNPNAIITGPDFICRGKSAVLVASGGTNYNWNQGLGQGNTKNVTPLSTTTYEVTVTNSSGCTATASKTVEVRNNSAATINRSICQGGSFFFNGQQLTTAGTYFDTIPNSAGCDSIITLNLSVNAIVQVTLNQNICEGDSFFFSGLWRKQTGTFNDTATAAGGCDSITTLILTVNQNPIADAGTNKLISANCVTTSHFLGGTPTAKGGTPPYTIIWEPSIGLNNINLSNPIIQNVPDTTEYTVTVRDKNGCTATDQVTVFTIDLKAPIIQNGNILAAPQRYSNYTWLKNNLPIPGANDSVYIVTESGSYALVAGGPDGCKDTSNTVFVSVSFVSQPSILSAKIYPNPAHQKLYVEINEDKSFDLYITDLEGRILEHRANVRYISDIDISYYAKGIYVAKIVFSTNEIFTSRFCIVR